MASVSGSGDITITSGSANDLKIDISGSGNANSFGFMVHLGDVSIKGSGNAQVNVSDNLKVTVNGSEMFIIRAAL